MVTTTSTPFPALTIRSTCCKALGSVSHSKSLTPLAFN